MFKLFKLHSNSQLQENKPHAELTDNQKNTVDILKQLMRKLTSSYDFGP